MSDRDTIKQALHDAIAWQDSLEDAQKNSEWAGTAKAQAKKYRALLKKRYGNTRTPMDIQIDGATLVGLDELRAAAKEPK